MKSGYNQRVVSAYFQECGLPAPEFEFKFHPERKWRFDVAWPEDAKRWGGHNVAIEVQGGLFSSGRHNRGAAMLKEYEKLNEAAAMGWRVLFVQPRDLCTSETVKLIKRCLGI